MKLKTIISLLESEMPPAKSLQYLIWSIKDGHFTEDGSKLKVTDDFECNNKKLKSLVGCPQEILGDFYCNDNNLKSLEGCPQTVDGYFGCSNNQLESLKGCPQTVWHTFRCYNNNLTSLESIHFYFREIDGRGWTARADFRKNPIKSHILGLLKIKGLGVVSLDNKGVEKIINKYLPNASTKDIDDCRLELIEAGLEEFAKL